MFPAYFGAGGLVAGANDMAKCLAYSMGLIGSPKLPALLAATQTPATDVTIWGDTTLGLGRFITGGQSPSIWKHGDLDGSGTYLAFLPGADPGNVASAAEVFVLVNGGNVTGNQTADGTELARVVANDVLAMLQGRTRPADKAGYPGSRRRRAAWCPQAQTQPLNRTPMYAA